MTRLFEYERCGSGGRGWYLRTPTRVLPTGKRGGLDQKGAEDCPRWHGKGRILGSLRQFAALCNRDEYCCGMAVHRRQIGPVLGRPLNSERYCSMRRCAAAHWCRDFRTRPGSEFCDRRLHRHRALRAAALHGVHRLAARRHSQDGHRRESDEQTRDKFGELPHPRVSMILGAVLSRL